MDITINYFSICILLNRDSKQDEGFLCYVVYKHNVNSKEFKMETS